MQITENQRLKIFRKSLKLNQKEFGESIGLTQGGYSDIERGKNSVSGRIKIFLNQIHNINLHWLETGEGEMFSVMVEDLEKNFIGFTKPGELSQDEIEKLQLELEQQKAENFKLQSEINLYKDLCGSKDKIIEGLEERVRLMREMLGR
jgi:transcriptional regulator with XRE-family HTH domain